MSEDRVMANLKRVIDCCYHMLEIADHGDQFRQDAGCGIVYGSLRDSAYKVRQLARAELEKHTFQQKQSPKSIDSPKTN